MDKKQGVEYIKDYLSDPDNTLTRKEIVDILSDPGGKYVVPEKTAYRWYKEAYQEDQWMNPRSHTDKASDDKELAISTVRDLLNAAIQDNDYEKATSLSENLLKLHNLDRRF